MRTPRDVVEKIRLDDFGIGHVGDAQTQKTLASIRSGYYNSIDLLSRELYSDAVHFVLELLQNAEDNNYAANIEPFVRFLVRDSALTFQNNELGFRPEDVSSICSVGKSTKLKRLGYIGEKGIGFKSVFKVSDEPYIFSNGFSFSLPRKDDESGLGFIVPVWREHIPEFVDQSVTNIHLPFNEGGRDARLLLEDVRPHLLLFLKKLKTIEVVPEAGVSRKITKESSRSPNKVCIASNDTRFDWHVVSELLDVPSDVLDEKRQDIEQVELVLAFPLGTDGRPDGNRACCVYSFLPVRSYGLPFDLQADFILASSRQAILEDRPWNQWLRDSIPRIFLDAIEEFKQDEALCKVWFNFLPNSQQTANSFFEDLPSEIELLLRSSECILTSNGKWKRPAEVFFARNTRFQQLITDEDAEKFFGKAFAASDFCVSDTVLRRLGASQFELDDLLACLANPDWLNEKGDEWLICLFASLEDISDIRAIEKLKALKLIPLEGGDWAATKDGPVFFPLDKRTNYGFEADLRVVKRTLVPKTNPLTKSSRAFLKSKLGVRNADAYELINGHLLPLFNSDDEDTNWQSKSREVLFGATEYICDHLESFEKAGGAIEDIRRKLFIEMDKKTRTFDKAESLYLSAVYGNTNQIERVFENLPGVCFVEDTYLTFSVARFKKRIRKGKSKKMIADARKEFAAKWGKFFQKIGIETVLRVIKSSMPTPTWNSPDFDKVVNSGKRSRIALLLTLLDENWSRFQEKLELNVGGYSRRSKFSEQIRNAKWIPVQSGLACPKDLFLDTIENRRILGDCVQYSDYAWKTPDFPDDIGIHLEPGIGDVLQCLATLVKRKSEDTKHFHALYKFLADEKPSSLAEVRRRFSRDRLIFVPNSPRKYHSPQEAFWKIGNKLFRDSHASLEKSWRDLREFFLSTLDVQFEPKPSDYVSLLLTIDAKPSDASDCQSRVWAIYKVLEKQFENSESTVDPTSTNWWHDFVSSSSFWTQKNEFWKNDGDVFINDHHEYFRLFGEEKEVAFLGIPEGKYPEIERLTSAASIPLISSAVSRTSLETSSAVNCLESQHVLLDAISFIERLLYFKSHASFQINMDNGSFRRLRDVQVLKCDEIMVELSLNGITKHLHVDVAFDDLSIFVKSDTDDILDRVGSCVAREVLQVPDLEESICLILSKGHQEGMESWFRARNIPEVPCDDEFDLLDELDSEDEDHAVSNGMNVDSESETQIPQVSTNNGGGFRLAGESDALESNRKPAQSPSEECGSSSEVLPPSKDESLEPKYGLADVKSAEKLSRREMTPSSDGKATKRRSVADSPARDQFRVKVKAKAKAADKTKIDDSIAREVVVGYETRCSRNPSLAAVEQQGFDVLSHDPRKNITRLIEVKGLQQRWIGDATVEMTRAQFDDSRNNVRNDIEFWFYIVDGLAGDSPGVYPIRCPSRSVERFYFQAQDWISEVDQSDKHQLEQHILSNSDLPVLEFNEITLLMPREPFLTRYRGTDMSSVVKPGGLIRCTPVDINSPMPESGALILVIPSQLDASIDDGSPIMGEFRYQEMHSMSGELTSVVVSLRPKTMDVDVKTRSYRLSLDEWKSFRPFAICRPVLP